MTKDDAQHALDNLESQVRFMNTYAVEVIRKFILEMQHQLPNRDRTAAELRAEVQKAAERGYADRGKIPGQ